MEWRWRRGSPVEKDPSGEEVDVCLNDALESRLGGEEAAGLST